MRIGSPGNPRAAQRITKGTTADPRPAPSAAGSGSFLAGIVGLDGDVTGNSSDTTVEGLQGATLPAPGTPEDGMAITWDDAAGAWTYGALASLGGDVTGALGANTVVKIHGKTTPTPSGADDGKYLQYDDGGGQFVLTDPAVGNGGGRIDEYHLGGIGASIAATRMNWDVSATQTWRAMRAGAVTALLAQVDASRTAGTLTAMVYVNGSDSGLHAAIDGTNPDYKITTGSIALVAGDLVEVWLTTDGSWAPVVDVLAGFEYVNS